MQYASPNLLKIKINPQNSQQICHKKYTIPEQSKAQISTKWIAHNPILTKIELPPISSQSNQKNHHYKTGSILPNLHIIPNQQSLKNQTPSTQKLKIKQTQN